MVERAADVPDAGQPVLPRHRPVGDGRPVPVAPCPSRAEDLARQKEIRSRKSRTDQRTRERLPVLPALVSRSTTCAPRRPPDWPPRRPPRGRARPLAPHTSGTPTLLPAGAATCPVRRIGRVLDLGRGRDIAAHRDPHRGAHRTVPSQPHPVRPARHRGTRSAAADRTVEDRHRKAAGQQPKRPARD